MEFTLGEGPFAFSSPGLFSTNELQQRGHTLWKHSLVHHKGILALLVPNIIKAFVPFECRIFLFLFFKNARQWIELVVGYCH